MTKEKLKKPGKVYETNFAFNFVAGIISHDKRFFENLHERLLEYQDILMFDHFMDDKQDREAFFILLNTLDSLASTTRPLTDAELGKQFNKVLKQLNFTKKGSEVSHE